MGLSSAELRVKWQIQISGEIWLRSKAGHLSKLMQLLDILSLLRILGEVAAWSYDILLEKVLHELVLHRKVWIGGVVVCVWRKGNFS